jgi:predicted DNA-binding ribbon-helix-helix protein
METALLADMLAGPVKRSMTIAGHPTSISLEPIFWAALERAAREDALPLSALVARVDAVRIAREDVPNLASALRVWLFLRASGESAEPRSPGPDQG